MKSERAQVVPCCPDSMLYQQANPIVHDLFTLQTEAFCTIFGFEAPFPLLDTSMDLPNMSLSLHSGSILVGLYR